MKKILIITLSLCSLISCTQKKLPQQNDLIIADGEMPAIAKDNNNTLHLVFGNGDSIMYTYSIDEGSTFSAPVLIAELPGVFTYAMRGPQVAATKKGVLVTACTKDGNIYSYYKEGNNSWKPLGKVNDEDTVCKEGLMALDADGDNVFAAWLDIRGNKRNKIYGASSVSGGKTWSRNMLIYASPDSTVCECCKPSVAVSKNKVAVMFRNWLNGNRDLYFAQSNDSGITFSNPQKLGTGSWKLDGCPMDGGNLVINNNGELQTVWRRESKIYFDNPEFQEKEIGEGKNCTIETINNKNVFAWKENGKITIRKPNDEKIFLDEGSQPVLKTIDNHHIICVWENNKQIHASIVQL